MFNQFTGIGRLAADPEIRYTQSGKAVGNFTLCCDSGFGDKKRTEFVKCVAWEKVAENIEKYLSKGSKAMIQGEMQTKKWEKDGVTRYTTEVIARVVTFLDSKGDSGGSGDKGEQPAPASDYDESDEVPF